MQAVSKIELKKMITGQAELIMSLYLKTFGIKEFFKIVKNVYQTYTNQKPKYWENKIEREK